MCRLEDNVPLSTNSKSTKGMVFLKKDVVTSLEAEKLCNDHQPSEYLNKIHTYKKTLRHSINYGRLKGLEDLKSLTPKDVGSHRKSINIGSLKRSVVPIKEEKINKQSLEIQNLGIPSTRTDAANLIGERLQGLRG